MRRIIQTSETAIDGADFRNITGVMPDIKDNFIKWNNYGEYIMKWSDKEVEITTVQLDELSSKGYKLILTETHLIIETK